MLFAVVLVLLVIGTILFHIYSPWWFTPLASNWGNLDEALIITFWITGVVFVALNLFMAYAVWKYRYDKDRRAEYEPENTTLEVVLTVVTSIGVVGMLAPGLIAWLDYITVPEDAEVVEVIAQTWDWSYRFPGPDGVLGTTDARFFNVDNTFGLNPDDPYGQDDIVVQDNEVHLQIDQPYKVLLRSKDVLHDFYVPQFRAKMDMIPGLVSYLWFTPTKTGTYEVLCAEYCGTGHSEMRGYVVIDESEAFDEWLGEQLTGADFFAAAGTGEPTITAAELSQ